MNSVLMVLLLTILAPSISSAEGEDGENDKGVSVTDTVDAGSILFVGVGLSLLLDDVEDFKTPARGDSVLSIEMDSRYRPTIITGAMYSFDKRARYNVLVSAKFDPSRDGFLDGFLLGFAWRFNKTAALAVSYDLRLGTELKPRFRRDAASLVRSLKDHPNYSKRFSQYQINKDCDDLEDNKQYDGFPLYDPRDNRMLGSGADPFKKTFNSAFHIGIVFARTINLKGQFPED